MPRDTVYARRIWSTTILLAGLYGKPQDFVFWTAEDDWGKTHGVHLERTSPENILITVRDLGPGGFRRPTSQ